MREIIEKIEQEIIEEVCISCKGSAHLATGWVLDQKKGTILCGRCAKDFARWYKERRGRIGNVPVKIKKRFGKNIGTFQYAMNKSIKGD